MAEFFKSFLIVQQRQERRNRGEYGGMGLDQRGTGRPSLDERSDAPAQIGAKDESR
jgi:hypothetical protein